MAELLNHKWAPFKIGDIFDINKCDYGKDNKYELTDNISDMPVVSGQTTNNGVMGYVKREDIKSKIYKDCLTISTRGQYSGTVLYHEEDETEEEDNSLMREYLLYMNRLVNGVIICSEFWQDFFSKLD